MSGSLLLLTPHACSVLHRPRARLSPASARTDRTLRHRCLTLLALRAGHRSRWRPSGPVLAQLLDGLSRRIFTVLERPGCWRYRPRDPVKWRRHLSVAVQRRVTCIANIPSDQACVGPMVKASRILDCPGRARRSRRNRCCPPGPNHKFSRSRYPDRRSSDSVRSWIGPEFLPVG